MVSKLILLILGKTGEFPPLMPPLNAHQTPFNPLPMLDTSTGAKLGA